MPRLPEGERANTISHAFGWALSVVGAVVLMYRALATDDPWRIAGCAVFATALIVVYAASTLSHAVAHPEGRRFFRRLDQGSIYILIVGTYTPIAFAYLRTPIWWWLFFLVMWGIALHGLFVKLWLAHRVDAVMLRSYLLLGWMPVIPLVSLIGYAPQEFNGLILAGGIAYTLGTVFFMLDNARYHCHAIWHSLVMVGSVCHFVAIYYFVASPASSTSLATF